MHFNLNSFLTAVSNMVDFAEMDLLGVATNHGRRVAYISARMGREAGFSAPKVSDTIAQAMLHDNGLTETLLPAEPEPAPPRNQAGIVRVEGVRGHCDIGQRNIVDFPFLSHPSEAIRFHHERYDGQGYYGLRGDEIPMMAQIIGMADQIDALFGFSNPDRKRHESIMQGVAMMRGREISPRCHDIFCHLVENTSFWLDLHDDYIAAALHEQIPDIWQDISWDRVLDISRVFSRIVDSKSHFTLRHSSGLEEKAAFMARYYARDHETTIKLRIAASLHDIGKMAIPNAILDKPGKLTAEEMDWMREHIYYTRRCLEQVKGFGEITEWAANHHERLDGSGYPFGRKAETLDFHSRLMACLDVYQALTEDRPYRGGMNHDAAHEILYGQAQEGRLDAGIVADIDRSDLQSIV